MATDATTSDPSAQPPRRPEPFLLIAEAAEEARRLLGRLKASKKLWANYLRDQKLERAIDRLEEAAFWLGEADVFP